MRSILILDTETTGTDADAIAIEVAASIFDIEYAAPVDVDMLGRLFTRAEEMGSDLEAMLTRGLRPKALFEAVLPYDRRDEAKEAGFRWNDPIPRAWTRRMAIEDAALLPFETRQVGALIRGVACSVQPY